MQRTRETEFILIQHIDVKNRLRPLNEGAVEALAASMEKLGLRVPITVRVDPAEENPDVFLVAGSHRLEAAKRLGWDEIECFVTEEADEDRARMWEIAENLHRAELTTLERSDQVAEWVRLSDKLSETREGRPGAAAQASRELGLNERAVQRAVKVASLTPGAKAAALEAGLADNQSALLAAAREAPEQQAQTIREIAERGAVKPFKVAADPIDDVGALERQVARLMDAWNAAGPDARQEFLGRIDAPIMDRRFA